MDANAGARAAARQRKMEKDALFEQERIKFYNKETTLERTQDRNVIGYSRDLADAYVKALNIQGKGRMATQRAAAKYFAKQKVNEGGRSRTFGRNDYQALLAARAEVDGIVDTTLRRNMAYFQEGARRKFIAAQGAAREALGVPASYGAPVMMPPTNRLGGALQIASSVASIYSGFGGAGLFSGLGGGAAANPFQFTAPAGQMFGPMASDIKLKENIQHVGTSPQGYNIYEFNYKGGDVRFRGAMAQDVLQKNPMAVGIDQNYLTVDYRQIDVNMEVV